MIIVVATKLINIIHEGVSVCMSRRLSRLHAVLDASHHSVAHITRLTYYFKGRSVNSIQKYSISLLENVNLQSVPVYVLLVLGLLTLFNQQTMGSNFAQTIDTTHCISFF